MFSRYPAAVSDRLVQSVVVVLALQGPSVLQRDPSVRVFSVFTDVTALAFRALTAPEGR